MADHASAHGPDHHEADMEFHTGTYGSVMSLLKWGTVGCAIVAALVIWLIA